MARADRRFPRLGRRQRGAARVTARLKGQHTQERHLGTAARVRRQVQIPAPFDRNLVEELHVFRAQARGKAFDLLLIEVVIAGGAHDLVHRAKGRNADERIGRNRNGRGL